MKQFASLSVLILLLVSCGQTKTDETLLGKWQPVGDDSRVLEFTPEGYYNLFVGDMNIFQDIEEYGRIKYKIEGEGKKLKLNLLDETESKDFVNGEIEILSNNKISIAFYQNNGEINVKEEYIRISQ